MKRIAIVIVIGSLALSACGESSNNSSGGLPTVQTGATDTDHLLTRPMGKGGECERRLREILDIEYLAEHDVTVPDNEETRAAIAAGIVQVCEEGPADEEVHEGTHRVVHFVEHELSEG